jgi:hypothetical protein
MKILRKCGHKMLDDVIMDDITDGWGDLGMKKPLQEYFEACLG